MPTGFAAFCLVSHVVDDGEFGSLNDCSVGVLYSHESQRVQTSVYFGIFSGVSSSALISAFPSLTSAVWNPMSDSAPATAATQCRHTMLPIIISMFAATISISPDKRQVLQ